MNRLFIILILCCIASDVFSQNDTDSIQTADTVVTIRSPIIVNPSKNKPSIFPGKRRRVIDTARIDTTVMAPLLATDTTRGTNPVETLAIATQTKVVKRPIDSFYLKLLDNPFLRSKEKPIYLVVSERKRNSKDERFYLVLGLVLFLAFIKLVFSRYFQNIFRLFFQPSFRQKQTREQLQQGNLPSLLLNLYFVLSAGAYVSFVLHYYQFSNIGFWLLFLYSSLSLLVLYVGKYTFLRFAGWVFNVKEATDAYIFAVYLINKIAGVVLIPFTVIIAFSYPHIINVSITVSLLVIFLLFLYRYLVSYGPVRKEIKVSAIHFLFYIVAFEITPLILIHKTVMLYLNKSL